MKKRAEEKVVIAKNSIKIFFCRHFSRKIFQLDIQICFNACTFLPLIFLSCEKTKSIAMVVRFITRRFIGDYDPNLEKVYTHNTVIDNDVVLFEILDATGQMNVSTK